MVFKIYCKYFICYIMLLELTVIVSTYWESEYFTTTLYFYVLFLFQRNNYYVFHNKILYTLFVT